MCVRYKTLSMKEPLWLLTGIILILWLAGKLRVGVWSWEPFCVETAWCRTFQLDFSLMLRDHEESTTVCIFKLWCTAWTLLYFRGCVVHLCRWRIFNGCFACTGSCCMKNSAFSWENILPWALLAIHLLFEVLLGFRLNQALLLALLRRLGWGLKALRSRPMMTLRRDTPLISEALLGKRILQAALGCRVVHVFRWHIGPAYSVYLRKIRLEWNGVTIWWDIFSSLWRAPLIYGLVDMSIIWCGFLLGRCVCSWMSTHLLIFVIRLIKINFFAIRLLTFELAVFVRYCGNGWSHINSSLVW